MVGFGARGAEGAAGIFERRVVGIALRRRHLFRFMSRLRRFPRLRRRHGGDASQPIDLLAQRRRLGLPPRALSALGLES